jgi:DHA1 family tetracycline resistance protein-like MFS transporter
VQGVLTGPVVKRLGDRTTMILGLFGGAAGVACMGLAPTGGWFYAAMLPNALWGLAMPTLQSLMTSKVSESEQGQLQGANMSVSSIAGVLSPLFFGAVYAASVGDAPFFPHVGTSFFIAAGFLLAAAGLGMAVARRAGGSPSTAGAGEIS